MLNHINIYLKLALFTLLSALFCCKENKPNIPQYPVPLTCSQAVNELHNLKALPPNKWDKHLISNLSAKFDSTQSLEKQNLFIVLLKSKFCIENYPTAFLDKLIYSKNPITRYLGFDYAVSRTPLNIKSYQYFKKLNADTSSIPFFLTFKHNVKDVINFRLQSYPPLIEKIKAEKEYQKDLTLSEIIQGMNADTTAIYQEKICNVYKSYPTQISYDSPYHPQLQKPNFCIRLPEYFSLRNTLPK